ncbi:hypothetical protein [Acidithiobacillus sulfuriphilus]|uniref:Uncharacterized protein n=2 Tax=Acidithiobacillus sulfuriphilus TaxID=1867749 RepID=A0A3M8QZ99_9PROT|nr:hypothetical protein [Acidithiobacillus sulfuriphilus]RNF61648.1 hypothetical protein EC580_08160 [Acidithiobacillus sulfuriphilus]
MKQSLAHTIITVMLDHDATPRDEEERRDLAEMRGKSTRENLADLLLSLGTEGLRSYIEALLEESQEHPAAAKAAAENMLSTLEPLLALAGTLLREVH